jgi:hypothetical protein
MTDMAWVMTSACCTPAGRNTWEVIPCTAGSDQADQPTAPTKYAFVLSRFVCCFADTCQKTLHKPCYLAVSSHKHKHLLCRGSSVQLMGSANIKNASHMCLLWHVIQSLVPQLPSTCTHSTLGLQHRLNCATGGDTSLLTMDACSCQWGHRVTLHGIALYGIPMAPLHDIQCMASHAKACRLLT